MSFGLPNPNDARNACRVERRGGIHDLADYPVAGPAVRNRLSRVFWAVLATVAGIGALVSSGAGAFAPAEVEKMTLNGDEGYYVNTIRAFFFVAGGLAALSCFGLWKASHRGGLGFWRATARPALLGACVTLVGAGLTFASFFAVERVQLVGLAAATLGAAAFLFFWILRGPPFTLHAGDAYWGHALRVLFGIVTVASAVTSVRTFQLWSKQGYQLDLGGDRFAVQQVFRDHWNSRTSEMVTRRTTYPIPRATYNPLPVISGLMALLAVGGFSEMHYRKRLMRLARQGAFERLF